MGREVVVCSYKTLASTANLRYVVDHTFQCVSIDKILQPGSAMERIERHVKSHFGQLETARAL